VKEPVDIATLVLDADPDAMRARLLGTYKSNWNFLKDAVRGNLVRAGEATAMLVRNYQCAVAGGQRPAETWLVMSRSYSFELAGPLLGTILITSAAIEAFLRLAMRAWHERDRSRGDRAAGTSRRVELALREFDRLLAPKRLAEAYKAITRGACPSGVQSEFNHLCAFRNECFHADPVLITRTGREETTKKGHVRPHLRSGEAPQYPLLWNGLFPLALSHAIRAVALHDAIVGDLFLRQDRVRGDPIHDESRESGLVRTGLPRQAKVQLERASDAWDQEVLPGLGAVSQRDLRSLGRDLARPLNVRPVK
jgi:hypothetical protein